MTSESTRSYRREIVVVLAVSLLLLVYALGGPRSCQIRIDCGDRYYSVLGFPVELNRMSEPSRTKLLALSEQSKTLKPKWIRIPMQVGSNHVHRMCYGFYRDACAWADVDAEIAQALVEDIARYIEETHAQRSLPDTGTMLLFVYREKDGSLKVDPAWKKDEAALAYLQSKGIDSRRFTAEKK